MIRRRKLCCGKIGSDNEKSPAVRQSTDRKIAWNQDAEFTLWKNLKANPSNL